MAQKIKVITPTIRPEPKQKIAYQLLWDKVTRFLGFGGGAGGGKSWLGCEWLLTNCYRYPGTRWFIGRQELKRVMASSYITFKKVCLFHGIPDSDWKLNQQYNYIEFIDGKAKGSRIDLLDLAYKPSDPNFDRFGSLEYTGGWIEEGQEVKYLCFDVLKARVGRYLNDKYDLFPAKILITFNPSQNWLFSTFYRPWKDRTLPEEYSFVQSLYNDNSYTAKVYGEQLDLIKDPILKARLRDGLWEYEEKAFINYDAILDLFTNEVEPSQSIYLTADIARFGGDKIVMGGWDGYNLKMIEERSRQSLVRTEEDIRGFSVEQSIPYRNIIVDEDGLGGGVVDHLAGIHGFMGNRSPILKTDKEIVALNEKYENLPASYLKKLNYKNLRAQCYYVLAGMINNHEIAISADITELQREFIIEELQQIRPVDKASDAPLQIVAKDDIKESLGRSPDYADMLMMRMYFSLIREDKKGMYNPPDKQKLMEAGAETEYGGIAGYGVEGFGSKQ